eukprot:TRINITY_DN20087_c0_g1_i2.p1 TRINITY_DN20087_c0_g1~~TRINITY_DN20087_c0_g1_i2.p1  ORF type:complete len:328 (+),score=30.20 TRINITY_DN20087_c0_g1_i2:23-1006(+)
MQLDRSAVLVDTSLAVNSSSDSFSYNNVGLTFDEQWFFFVRALLLSPFDFFLGLGVLFLLSWKRYMYLYFLSAGLFLRAIENIFPPSYYRITAERFLPGQLAFDALPELFYAQTYYCLIVQWLTQAKVERLLEEMDADPIPRLKKRKRLWYAIGISMSTAVFLIYIFGVGFGSEYHSELQLIVLSVYFSILGIALVVLFAVLWYKQMVVGTLKYFTAFLIFCFITHFPFIMLEFYVIPDAQKHHAVDRWYQILWIVLQFSTEIVPAALILLLSLWGNCCGAAQDYTPNQSEVLNYVIEEKINKGVSNEWENIYGAGSYRDIQSGEAV